MLAALTRSSPQLCAQCNKKPRHAGHPYCSKTCAQDANSTPSNASKMCIQCNQRPKFQGFDFCGKTCARAAQTANPTQAKNAQQQPAPRVSAPQKNSQPTLHPATAVKRAPIVSQPASQKATCRNLDCWEPVETDARGIKISDYCSEEHAEEAVLSGVVDACVMCLKMPQTDNDYFCSRACKEQSMQK